MPGSTALPTLPPLELLSSEEQQHLSRRKGWHQLFLYKCVGASRIGAGSRGRRPCAGQDFHLAGALFLYEPPIPDAVLCFQPQVIHSG
jgi:hypothetical protein